MGKLQFITIYHHTAIKKTEILSFATKLWNEYLLCLGQQVRHKRTVSTFGLITKVYKRQPESMSKKKYTSLRGVKKVLDAI